MPLHMPSSPQVIAPWSSHWPSGSWLSGTFRHVPSLPETAHDRHVPVHIAEQQRPWAHTLELHSASAPQAAPIGFLPQLPPMHVLGARQSASVEQVVRQAPIGPHTYGVHDSLLVPAQVPALSHVPGAVSVDPVQPPGWQMTPAPKRAHCPVPSQTPVRPHTAAVSVGHRSPGFVPAAEGRQVPSAPGDTHVKQASVHAVLQHTPSAQNSEAHSSLVAQGSPICLTGRSRPPLSAVVMGVSLVPASTGGGGPASSFMRASPPPPHPMSSATITGNSSSPPLRTHPSARHSGWEATIMDVPFAKRRFRVRARTEAFTSTQARAHQGEQSASVILRSPRALNPLHADSSTNPLNALFTFFRGDYALRR
jgi:hypothetical protein